MWVPYQTGETFTPQVQVKQDVLQQSKSVYAAKATPTQQNSSHAVKSVTQQPNTWHATNIQPAQPIIPSTHYTTAATMQKSKNSDKTILNTALFTETASGSNVKQNNITDEKPAKTLDKSCGKVSQTASTTTHHARHENKINLPILTLQTLAFIALYLCGGALAGQIYPRLASADQLYLTYYVNYYLSAASDGQVFSLFCSNLIAATVSLSAVFLMGLSAFGIPLLFVFLLCKGLGCALILLHLFAQYQWNGVLYYLLLFGVLEAILVTSICLLSVTAAKSAGSIFKYTLYTANGAKKSNLKRFIKQYCLLMLLMTLVCACAAVVAYCVLPYLSLTVAVV